MWKMGPRGADLRSGDLIGRPTEKCSKTAPISSGRLLAGPPCPLWVAWPVLMRFALVFGLVLIQLSLTRVL